MKMKKILSKLAAAIIAAVVCVSSSVNAADLVASDIYDNTIFRPEYRTGSLGESIFSEMIANFITDAIKEVDSEVKGNAMNHVKDSLYSISNYHLQNLNMPSFGYLSGKTKLKWLRTLQQTTPYTVEVQIDLFWCSGYEYDYTPWLTWSDGVKIPVNSLVYTIKRDDGNITRYFLRPNRSYGNTPYSVVFSVSDDNDYFSLPMSAWDTTVYRITGDETFETANFSYSPREKRLFYNQYNDIDFGLPRNSYGTPIEIRYPMQQYPRQPSDQEIINGYINYYPTGNSSYYPATDFDFWVSYYSTNDESTANWLKNSSLTADWQQNWYYNDQFKNGDSITNNNYSNKYNDAFAPVFDVDLGDIDIDTIIPQISAGLEPIIKFGIDDLLDALMDFFGDMPDIGLTWDSNTSNNYYDIIPLEPEYPPTTGDINITVDITRPDIPYIDTSPNVSLYVPTVTTTALPSGIISNSKKIVSVGKDITDMVGVTDIIIWCGLVGVGVMLIFKDW